ncbi:sensor histidine kinase [Bartonella sp. DGB2]|uniref:sensor histidine kinase n=1 Tax=Bartonella sp. DGB2 TaxID=3388426 RepID=UPI00398FEB46
MAIDGVTLTFSDYFQCREVRQAFLRGWPAFVLSSDAQKILWCNGAGAAFLGFERVSDVMEGRREVLSPSLESPAPPAFDGATCCYILTCIKCKAPLSLMGATETVVFSALELKFPVGKGGVVESALFLQAIEAPARPVPLLFGLVESDESAALLDEEGRVLAVAGNFTPLKMDDKILLNTLYDYRPLHHFQQERGRGIERVVTMLRDKPRCFLWLQQKGATQDRLEKPMVNSDCGFSFPPHFYWQMDAMGRFCGASPEIYEGLKTTGIAFMGYDFAQLASLWGEPKLLALYEAQKKKQSFCGQKVHWPLGLSGKKIVVELSATPIFDTAQNVSYWRGFGKISSKPMEVAPSGVDKALPATDLTVEPGDAKEGGLSAEERSAFREIAARLRTELADSIPAPIRQNVELKVMEDGGACSLKKREDRPAPPPIEEQIAMLMHEIRTPLNAMIGFAQLMHDGRFGAMGNPRYQRYLQDMIRSGQHILSLINKGLAQAKAGHTKSVLEEGQAPIIPFDVAETLRDSLAFFAPEIEKHGHITRIILPSYLPMINLSEQEFRQIIWNLLANALRFTPPRGRIILYGAHDEKRGVKVAVRDNGVGMTEAEIEQALKPYGQVARKDGKSGDEIFTGTGLGLPLCKSLVEKGGGVFTLISRPHEGTSVEMLFPLAGV